MASTTATTAEMQARTLVRGEKVRLVADRPGLPSGAEGRVAMANGFAWRRYWVRFDDGPVVGHIDHGDLVRARDYDGFLAARDREAEQAAAAEAVAATAAGGGAEADMGAIAAGGTGETVVNGVTVPTYLLQRSADARTRLGA